MDQAAHPPLTPGARRCRRKFLEYFPEGFHDPEYLELERGYKVETHQRWEEALGSREFQASSASRSSNSGAGSPRNCTTSRLVRSSKPRTLRTALAAGTRSRFWPTVP